MSERSVAKQYGCVVLVYALSRLIIASGFYFSAFFASAVFQTESLPPHMAVMRGTPFRWLSGDTELTMPPPPSGTRALSLYAAPFRENLEVTVRIDGGKAQTLVLTSGTREYEIPLPPSLVQKSQQEGQPFRVTFRSTAYRPRDLMKGLSQDGRLLAFGLTRIGYSPHNRPLQLSDRALFSRGAYDVEWISGLKVSDFLRKAMFQWDARWYGSIVEPGYMYQAGLNQQQNVNFFPLYPAITFAIQRILGLPIDLVLWGLANLLGIATVLLLFHLVSRTVNPDAAWSSVVLLSFYPGSLFFSLPYPESLLALLTVLFFRWVHGQRLALAACASGLATACRPTGMVLAPALAWAYYTGIRGQSGSLARKILPGVALLFLSVSGVIAYGLYLHWRFDDALAFVRVRSAWITWTEDWLWSTISGRPFWRVVVGALRHNPLSFFVVPSIFDTLTFATALTLLVIVIIGRLPTPRAWLIVGLLSIALPYAVYAGSNVMLNSTTRYQAANIPLFLYGGIFLSKPGRFHWLAGITAIQAIVLFVFSSLFAAGLFLVG